MPIPTQSDVHTNQPLTQLTEAFFQKMTDFVSMVVFPPVPVDHKSDVYYKFDRSYFFRDAMQLRAPGAEAEASGYGLSTATYTAQRWDLAHPIPDAIRQNADKMINLDYAGTQFLTHQALINREVRWAKAFFANSLWTTSITGQATADASHVKFWDTAGSTPIEDVLTGKQTIKASTGMDANVLVLGYKTKKALKTNPEIIDRLKYGQTAPGAVVVKDTDLAQLFEVDRVVTMGAIKTTSAEGAATATYDFIGGSHALLAYAAPAPGLMVASAGYTFNWQGLPGVTANGWRIKKYRHEPKESDILEIQQAYAQVLAAPDLGYFFNAVLSA